MSTSPKIDFRRVFTIAGIAVLGLVYLVLWIGMINSRAERTGTDFLGFYVAARIAQTDGVRAVYDPVRQQALEQEQVGFELAPGQVLLFNHLPYFLPLLALIVDANYLASFLRWTVLLLAILLLDACLAARLLLRSGFAPGEARLAAAGALLFFPTFTSLMNGQETVFVLLGLLLWMWGLVEGKDWLAGLGLALVTIRPQLALILALPFLARRRKVLAWFALGSAALGLYCFLLLGPAGVRSLVEFLLISSRGEAYGLHLQDMPSLTGILHRLAPGLDAGLVQSISLGGYLAAMLGLVWFFWKSREVSELQIGLAVLVSLLFVPYLHYHDVAILFVPLLCGLRLLRRTGLPAADLALLPLAASFVLLAGFFAFAIRYPMTYLVMAVLAFGLLSPARTAALRYRSRRPPPAA